MIAIVFSNCCRAGKKTTSKTPGLTFGVWSEGFSFLGKYTVKNAAVQFHMIQKKSPQTNLRQKEKRTWHQLWDASSQSCSGLFFVLQWEELKSSPELTILRHNWRPCDLPLSKRQRKSPSPFSSNGMWFPANYLFWIFQTEDLRAILD